MEYKLTDCLIDTGTGEEVETEYRMRETPINRKIIEGGNATGVSQRKTDMIYMSCS